MPDSAARGFPEDLGSEGSAPGQGGTRDEHALHIRTERRATRVSCGVGKQRGVEVACTLWAPKLQGAEVAGRERTGGWAAIDRPRRLGL
jgi:hypothetical protein